VGKICWLNRLFRSRNVILCESFKFSRIAYESIARNPILQIHFNQRCVIKFHNFTPMIFFKISLDRGYRNRENIKVGFRCCLKHLKILPVRDATRTGIFLCILRLLIVLVPPLYAETYQTISFIFIQFIRISLIIRNIEVIEKSLCCNTTIIPSYSSSFRSFLRRIE
jgi:hypothetical protein